MLKTQHKKKKIQLEHGQKTIERHLYQIRCTKQIITWKDELLLTSWLLRKGIWKPQDTRYHYTVIQMVKIKSLKMATKPNTNEKLDLSYIAHGDLKWYSHFKKCLAVSHSWTCCYQVTQKSYSWNLSQRNENFFFFFLINIFLVVLGLHCCSWAFSSCGKQGLLFVAWHGLLISCSVACGIFPDQRLNPCPLSWKVGSYLLYHQGSPPRIFFHIKINTQLFIEALFVKAPNYKQPICLKVDEWLN